MKKQIVLNVRKISQGSIGAAISAEDSKEFGIVAGDELTVEIVDVKKNCKYYHCNVCNYEFSEEKDEQEIICPACQCDDERALIQLADDYELKGGNE